MIKKCLRFNHYFVYLEKKQKILRLQQRFKSDERDVYTEEVNKIALSFNDYKRLMSYDGITTYSYGISAEILCK